MLEVGKKYEVTTLETGADYEGKVGTFENRERFECVAINGSLVTFRTPDLSKYKDEDDLLKLDGYIREDIVINTNSLFFHSAKEVKDER